MEERPSKNPRGHRKNGLADALHVVRTGERRRNTPLRAAAPAQLLRGNGPAGDVLRGHAGKGHGARRRSSVAAHDQPVHPARVERADLVPGRPQLPAGGKVAGSPSSSTLPVGPARPRIRGGGQTRAGVAQKEKDELLGAVSTLKPDIVASPAANK